MAGRHSSISVLRIAGILIIGFAFYHFLFDWEWIPDLGGWGTGRLVALLFWAVLCVILDLVLRRVIRDQARLNVTEAMLLSVVVGIMIWSA